MTSTRSAALLLLLAACGGNPAPEGGVAAGGGGEAPRGPVLIAPAPPIHYALHRRDSVMTRLPDGNEVPQVAGRTTFLTVTITPPAAGTTGESRISFRADSVTIDSGTSRMAQAPLEGVAGTTWSGEVSPTGVISALAPDRQSAGADLLTPDLARWLPTLPAGGVRPGEMWTDTLATLFPFSNLNIQVAESLVAQWQSHSGTVPVGIELTATGTLTRTGSSNIVTLLGSGSRSARYVLAPDGTLLSAQGTDSVLMRVTVKAVGQSVTARQLGQFSVTRRP